MAALTAWSYGFAGIAYAVYGLYFARGAVARSPDGRSKNSSRSMISALAVSALWGLAGSGFGFTGGVAYLVVYLFSEPLRYACW